MTRWSSTRWRLSLTHAPTVAQVGVGVHGLNGTVERYLLRDLWCVHVYGYEGTLLVGGRELPLRPGYVSVCPAGAPLEYRFHGRSRHLYAHFRPAPDGAPATLPALTNLGADYPAVRAQFERAVASSATAPERVCAFVWHLLGDLAERASAGEAQGDSDATAHHPAVRRAAHLIELRLGEPLRVEEVAQEVGVSSAYLSRLFRDAFGESVVGYLRRRRMERAEHLLRRTTLPVKVVGASVGLADPHQFNKAVRAHFGASPRAVREGSAPPSP